MFIHLPIEKRTYLLIIISLLFYGIRPVVAFQSEANSEKTYLITYVTVNVFDDFTDAFFTRLQHNLDQLGYKTTIEDTTPENERDAAIDLTFNAEYNTQRIIKGQSLFIETNSVPVHAVSPFLINSEAISILNGSPENDADVATASFLFSEGDCELANHYLPDFDKIGLAQDTTLLRKIVSFYRGNCALVHNNLEDAAYDFENALPENPDYEPYLSAKINLSWVYFEQKEQDKALNTLTKLLNNPKELFWSDAITADIFSHRAQLYALAARYDDAVADMTTAIQLDPTNPSLYTLRGQMYLYLYQWDNVLADYNKAIQLDPSDADAYFDRGILYYSILQTGAENYPLALADFQHYLQLAPDGDYAADTTKYVAQIQAEQQALGK